MNINFETEVLAAISTRADGNMRLHGHAEFDAPAIANRIKWLNEQGIASEHVVSAGLIHSAAVATVSDPKRPGVIIEKTDALITDQRGVYLAITAADCPPLYLYDPVNHVVGLAHCGWKGILNGVIDTTVSAMRRNYNSYVKDIRATIGPGIGCCHFEVKDDVALKFARFVEIGADGKKYVDLNFAISTALSNLGITVANINEVRQCTSCALEPANPQSFSFFSFRRDKSDPLQTMMCVIGMK